MSQPVAPSSLFSPIVSVLLFTYGVDVSELRLAVEDEVAKLVADLSHLLNITVGIRDPRRRPRCDQKEGQEL